MLDIRIWDSCKYAVVMSSVLMTETGSGSASLTTYLRALTLSGCPHAPRSDSPAEPNPRAGGCRPGGQGDRGPASPLAGYRADPPPAALPGARLPESRRGGCGVDGTAEPPGGPAARGRRREVGQQAPECRGGGRPARGSAGR